METWTPLRRIPFKKIPFFSVPGRKIFPLVLDKKLLLWHSALPFSPEGESVCGFAIPEEQVILLKINQIMVAIRLTRQGSKNRPYYKIVVVDSRTRRDGAFIDQVGTYDPMKEGVNYTLDLEKVDQWIKNGAQPSETVSSMIRKARSAAQV